MKRILVILGIALSIFCAVMVTSCSSTSGDYIQQGYSIGDDQWDDEEDDSE